MYKVEIYNINILFMPKWVKKLSDLISDKKSISEYRSSLQKRYDFLRVTGLFEWLMSFWIDCNDWWLPLLTKLFADINKEINKNNISDFRVIQIKEKFWQLRVYTYWWNKIIRDLISDAENKSMHICEVCWEAWRIDYDKSWYKCLCEKHK